MLVKTILFSFKDKKRKSYLFL